MAEKTLIAIDYPSVEQWKELLKTFSSQAIAHKMLLSTVPYVFRNEPFKFAVFRKVIADAFGVNPTDVFIVGSALAGRSLKAAELEQVYSSESDFDTLIISEPLFTSQVMKSLEWVSKITAPTWQDDKMITPELKKEDIIPIGRIATHACRGIWRPDALPKGASVREEFFDKFNKVSIPVLGLQLSDDTVAKVNGRIARSFDDAVEDLAASLRRLANDLDYAETHPKKPKVQPLSTAA